MKGKITESRKGKRYFIDKGGVRGFVEVTKKEYEAAFPDKKMGAFTTHSIKGWPRKSLALGVHPSQKKEAEDFYAKMGVPTEISASDGKAIMRDNAHQRSLTKALGVHNNDGGYGSITG